ncbi:MAG: hypothetical protein Q4B57_00025 [Eubacteriales bacterium]|nr:hypothetical protein [Eubacteriales bacterium]
MNNGTEMPNSFGDSDAHDVLARSGYLCKKFPDSDWDSEWYQVNLETAVNAIHAFKEGRRDLTTAEKVSKPTGTARDIKRGITLRDEQKDAVETTMRTFRTGDRMLWDCKMRFGKTVSAYELIKQAGFQKTIVVTHRPVVEDGWQKDHDLIFGADSLHMFVTKKITGSNYEFDNAIDAENNRILENYAKRGTPFVYFASMPTAYRYETEDTAFNFREFFRTWTGDPKQDYRPIPAGARIGDFVHEADVNAFLDFITREDADSHYPFANQQYRDMFKHTFWMVPWVKETRALSVLLKKHPVFKQFGIANVAGEGDQEESYDDALKKVRETI